MLIVCNPTVDLTICLAISHLVVTVALRFPGLSNWSFWRSCFLSYPGRPPPRTFTPFLPCCFDWRFLLNVRRFEVYRPVIFARRVAPLRAATNFSRGPRFTLVHSCAKMSLLRRATAARRDTFLSAMVTRFRDPQYPRALSFGFWRRSAARFRFLRRFLGSPTGITAASLWWPLDAPLRTAWSSNVIYMLDIENVVKWPTEERKVEVGDSSQDFLASIYQSKRCHVPEGNFETF
jgi:hypothetical protein